MFSGPTDVLQALNYPSVTNLRASTDYYYGSSWDIGLSSLLITARKTTAKYIKQNAPRG